MFWENEIETQWISHHRLNPTKEKCREWCQYVTGGYEAAKKRSPLIR
jgi:hypothetical protein